MKVSIKVAPFVWAQFGEPYRPLLYWLANALDLRTMTMMMLMTCVKMKLVSETRMKVKVGSDSETKMIVKVINFFFNDWLTDWDWDFPYFSVFSTWLRPSLRISIQHTNFCLPLTFCCASFPDREWTWCVLSDPGSRSRNYHHLLKCTRHGI